MNFSSAVQAQLDGRIVRVDALAQFSFVSQTIRLWNGFGPLLTLDGNTWEGIGGLGSIQGLEQSYNGAAPTQTLTLSGVESRFAATARGDSAEYYRRPVTTYLQFFDEDWQPLDNPYAIALRQMETIKATRRAEDGGVFTYTVTLTAETPFNTRRRPAYGYNTDRDQQLRHPGDKGMERTAGIDGKTIIWPDY